MPKISQQTFPLPLESLIPICHSVLLKMVLKADLNPMGFMSFTSFLLIWFGERDSGTSGRLCVCVLEDDMGGGNDRGNKLRIGAGAYRRQVYL